MINEVNTTTINQITQNNLRSTPAPIPPLGEQHRIIAKVDELMTLCDRLEGTLTDRDNIRRSMLDALLAEALMSEGSSDRAPENKIEARELVGRFLRQF